MVSFFCHDFNEFSVGVWLKLDDVGVVSPPSDVDLLLHVFNELLLGVWLILE